MENKKELILALRKDKKFYREEITDDVSNEEKNTSIKKYKYYENDEELFAPEDDATDKRDQSNKTNDAKFSDTIKNELSILLGSGFDNIILFLGAGGSIIMGNDGLNKDYGETIDMIAQDVNSKLKEDDDLYNLDEISDIVNYMGKNIYKKKNELKDDFNLEDFLSRLVGYIKYAKDDEKDKLNHSKKEIFKIIKDDTIYNDTLSSEFGHRAVLKYFSGLLGDEHKLNVVTTNYDTVIEDSAEYLKFNVIDGFSFSSHPTFDSSLFDWTFAKSIPNLKSNEIVYKPNVINLFKIHGSVSWQKSKYGVLRNNPMNIDLDDSVMVFPTSDKYEQSYEEPYFELFSKFRELLQIPNSLIFTSGFSFADNHISRIILDALKTNNGLSLIVTDYNIREDNNNNIQELYDLMENNYPVSFLKASMNDDLNKYLGATDVDR